MANQEDSRLMQALIKNPNAMIVEVIFENDTTAFVPFQCKRFPENTQPDESLFSFARTFVQSLLGVKQKGDEINPMEEEFPGCLECPGLPLTLNPLLPSGKKPIGVVSVWSRNAITHNVPMNRAPYVPSLN